MMMITLCERIPQKNNVISPICYLKQVSVNLRLSVCSSHHNLFLNLSSRGDDDNMWDVFISQELFFDELNLPKYTKS